MCESFFATLECELLDRRRFASQAQARMAVFTFIEGFYNPVRLHSALVIAHPSATNRRCSPTLDPQAFHRSTKTVNSSLSRLQGAARRRLHARLGGIIVVLKRR